ncbi:MAG: DUF1844 domain-containing protein [Myxococcota bacterium]
MSEDESKGFVVKDRRRFDAEGNVRPADDEPADGQGPDWRPPEEVQARQAEAKVDEPPPAPSPPPPPEASGEGSIGFSELVMSVATTALAYLGREPGAGEVVVPGQVNLRMAAQNIDILGMLQAKTRNNLSKDEEDLLNSVLYELRTLYLETARSLPRTPPAG